MKRTLGFAAIGILLVAMVAWAQVFYLPGTWTRNAIPRMADHNSMVPSLVTVTAAGNLAMPSAMIGGATPTAITNIRVYSQTITPGSVAAAVCAQQTFTVTGLATTDTVFINPVATGNATSAGQVLVSAVNTLAVTYCNPTAGALTPAAGTMAIVAIRS